MGGNCRAGWGSCPAPSLGALAVAQPATYEWVDAGDGESALFLGPRQVGSYRDGVYRPILGGEWGEACEPPLPAPGKPAQAPVFGLEWGKVSAQERFAVNGRECGRAEAIHAIGKNVPDDAKKLRVTVIGSDEELRRVADDLAKNPLLTPLRERYVLQLYPPDRWAVRGVGFVTTGHPTIYLQAPDGKVLHRQDAYAGPESLAAAIRKASPEYDPQKDPNLTAPALTGLLDFASKVPPPVWLMAATFLLLMLPHRQD